MFKKNTLLLFSIFLANTINAQYNFPSFEQLVNTFFSNYDLRTGQDFDDLRFVKQKEGYFIEEYDVIENEYRQKTLFWSTKENDYQKLGFPENSDPDTDHIERHLTYLNNELFNTLPFYGYVGWPKDVITFLEEKPTLEDIEHYALGRAYSSRASHLLNNNFDFAEAKAQFDVKESGKNQFSQQQLKTYKEFVGKAIASYTELCQKNPDYPTIVGGICNKLHNEYVTTFLNLAVYQNEAEAMKFLPEGLYSDFFMDYAKNYLNSVERNAILFTTGDNDTFPFLYAQAKLHHRQDVLVVNTSLLNQNSYVNHLRNDTVFASPPIQFTLLPETYNGEKLDVIVLTNETIPKGYLNLKDGLNLLNSGDPSTNYEAYSAYSRLPSNRMAISVTDKTAIELDYEVPYVLQGELLALDIVQANIKNRPIYCTFNEIPIVSSYLEQAGFAYKLTAEPQNKIEDVPYLGGIDADKTFALLVNNFEFHENTENHLETKLSVLLAYASTFEVLSGHYLAVDDIKKCEEVLSVFIEFYPKDMYLESRYIVLDMAKTAYKIGLVEKGDDILNYLLKNMAYEQKLYEKGGELTMTQILKQKIFGKKAEKYFNEEKLEEYLYFLNDLKNLEPINTNLQERITALETYFSSAYDKP